MNDSRNPFVTPEQLRIGMFVELEVGWMAHPFPKGSFKISSNKQIETICGLGLARVRFIPEKSDLPGDAAPDVVAAVLPEPPQAVMAVLDVPEQASASQLREQATAQTLLRRKERAEQMDLQQRNLALCERQFSEAIRNYKKTIEQISTQPAFAAEQCLALVNGFVDQMLTQGESAIRLLSESMGDRASMHPVNVAVVALLLGKAMGLAQADMVDLGMAAFLHDIGKTQLPDRVRWLEDNFTAAEYKLYQDHVAQGSALGRRAGLSSGVLSAIEQHHELVDGSGFPLRLKGDSLTKVAKILALVNRYENLCNPIRLAAAMTPHEALALLFAQFKNRYDSVALNAFIRMMGVYPPGSVVQLVDERYALVVSVNSARPLKPRLIVYEPSIAKNEALILDMEQVPSVGIRRSIKPSHLPKGALDYLSPRQRISYFFEQAVDLSPAGGY